MDQTRVDAEGLAFDPTRIGEFTDVVTNENCLLLYRKHDGSLSLTPPTRMISAANFVVSPLLTASYTIEDMRGNVMRIYTCSEAMPDEVLNSFEKHRALIPHMPRHERDLGKLGLIMRMEMVRTTPIVQDVLLRLKAAAHADRTNEMVANDMKRGGYVLV